MSKIIREEINDNQLIVVSKTHTIRIFSKCVTPSNSPFSNYESDNDNGQIINNNSFRIRNYKEFNFSLRLKKKNIFNIAPIKFNHVDIIEKELRNKIIKINKKNKKISKQEYRLRLNLINKEEIERLHSRKIPNPLIKNHLGLMSNKIYGCIKSIKDKKMIPRKNKIVNEEILDKLDEFMKIIDNKFLSLNEIRIKFLEKYNRNKLSKISLSCSFKVKLRSVSIFNFSSLSFSSRIFFDSIILLVSKLLLLQIFISIFSDIFLSSDISSSSEISSSMFENSSNRFVNLISLIYLLADQTPSSIIS